MKIEDKALLLTGDVQIPMSTKELPEYHTGVITMSDGPQGVRKTEGTPIPGGNVAFPTGSAQAATWNPELIREMAHHLALNCHARDVKMLLAPAVNIQRSPLCGRNFEYYSEDPFLTGEIGAAYINGLQEYGVGTSLKHFAANQQENLRGVINAELAERPLREIYLAVFEHILKKSNPTSIMCAYNKVNGHYCSENKKLLTDILRNEWGYDGLVVSDWGAVHNVGKVLKAGLDLVMPARNTMVEEVLAALDNGEITHADVDRAVDRVLTAIRAIDALPKPEESFDRAAAHEMATEVEREAITLLKNEERILPIDTNRVKKIGVVGYYAESPLTVGGAGSGTVSVDKESVDSPLDYIRQYAGDAEILYTPIYQEMGGNISFTPMIEIQKLSRQCDMLIMFAGYPPYWEIEGEDRETLQMPVHMIRMMEECSRFCKNTAIVTQTGSPYAPFIRKAHPKAIVQMWYGGEGAGKAIAEVLFGRVNPSGKLPMTFMTEENPDLAVEYDGRYIDYKEGLFVGYRYYDQYPDKIWFPFGHGLSYTSFAYSDLKVTTEDYLSAKVTFKVTNTGDRAGKEVCQLYVKPLESSVLRPEKELKGFAKLELAPGETKEAVLFLDERDFSYYNTNDNAWFAESGRYEILIGASSRDIRLAQEMEICNPNQYTINRNRWSDGTRKEIIG